MINVYICDNSEIMLKKQKVLLQNIALNNQVGISIKGFTTGKKLLENFENDFNLIDLIYLDVKIDGKSGIDFGKKLKSMGYEGQIIFIAPDESCVLQSFEVGPISYLIKNDESQKELERSFLGAVDKVYNRRKECLVCGKGNKMRKISIEDIYYLESKNRTTKVTYKRGEYLAPFSLSVFEEKLIDKNFMRINRNTLINIIHIDEKETEKVRIMGKKIPIGKSFEQEVQVRIPSYLWEHYNCN